MDQIRMTRREFTAVVSGLFVSAAFPAQALAKVTSKNEYSVSILGDMHYDVFPSEKYHAKAIPIYKANPKRHSRLKEFQRNAEMWQDLSPRVLKAATKVIRRDTAFALQLGDLIQGDCMDDTIHKKMLHEATDLLQKTFPDLPVVSLCGNHDVRDGKTDEGATEAYADYMVPWQSGQLARYLPRGIATTTFGFRSGKDLWICLDFTYGKRDVEIVKKLLADNPDVRYTFVTSHGPVLPMDIWHCRWFYLGAPALDGLRREMRALFAKRNAIVLSGHIHTVELRDWYGDGGRITEFVFNTVQSGKLPNGKQGNFPAEPWIITDKPEDFGKWVKEGGKYSYNEKDENSKKCTARMAELYDEYRPGLKTYMTSRAMAHYMLRVSDKGVKVELYGHEATKPTKVYTLR